MDLKIAPITSSGIDVFLKNILGTDFFYAAL
jgi:hypothetical protein